MGYWKHQVTHIPVLSVIKLVIRGLSKNEVRDKIRVMNDKTLATLSKITQFLLTGLRYITFEVRGDTKFFFPFLACV